MRHNQQDSLDQCRTSNSNSNQYIVTTLVLLAVWILAPQNAVAGKPFADFAQLAPDTYSISRIDHGGVFGNAGKMNTAVYKEAQEFAASVGKVAVARHVNEIPFALGRFASIEYEFWVLDKADAAAHREDFHKDADRVLVEHVQIDSSRSRDTLEKTDLYAGLLKLDDLRKRGLLTDAEYDNQKQKLLNQ